MNRFQSDQTRQELISSLHYIFPVEEAIDFDSEKILSALELTAINREGGQYLFWSNADNGIIVILYDLEIPHQVYRGFLMTLVNKPQNLDLAFGNYFCKVFNDDIKIIPNQKSHTEIWLSMRQTQFRRAIAKFSAFSTEPMIKWMQLIENSISLKYENKPFSFCLFMTKQRNHIQDPLGDNFIPFSETISFEKGIMNEKWLRGAMSGQKNAIASYGHAGQIFGMFAIPTDYDENLDNLLSPHDELTPITNLLVNGTCMFLTTDNGDIYLILSNKATFYKTQGRWHYLNYSNIHIVLSNLLKENIAKSILRLSLDLSYKRQGALVFIPDNKKKIKEIVPDFTQKIKVNKVLRNTVKGLSITNKAQRKIIMSSAKVDGSLIISANGETLDASCMIGQPTQSKLEEMQIEKLERFSGARSTAAWNASIYGTAIKISEDGPITIFRHGKLIAQVG